MGIKFSKPSDLLSMYRQRAKKRFGQHFLVDPSILDDLVESAGVQEGDRVLEIGPGCGTLTWTLLEHGASVVAVELDRDAASFLDKVLVPERDLEVIEGDVLELDIGEVLRGEDGWRCVSNLPYNVATEVFFRLAPHLESFGSLVLMFQKEVAERMSATVGEDDYGLLSLMVHLYADVELVKELSPGAFIPHPQVHSAAVRFEPVADTRIADREVRERFKRIARKAFQQRRKILPNALKGLPVDKERVVDAMQKVGLERRRRPERVSFEDYVALAEELTELG